MTTEGLTKKEGVVFWSGDLVRVLCLFCIFLSIIMALYDGFRWHGENLSYFNKLWAGAMVINLFIAIPMWLYQSHRRLHALNVSKLRFSSEKICSYYYIPIFNLFYIPQVVGEVWKASQPEVGPTTGYTSRKNIHPAIIWGEITFVYAFIAAAFPGFLDFICKWLLLIVSNAALFLFAAVLDAHQEVSFYDLHPELYEKRVSAKFRKWFQRSLPTIFTSRKTIDFSCVRLLEEMWVRPGDKWIYVADFNIKHNGISLKSTNRVDEEIEDLKQISDSGGITAILAHKGRFKDKDAEDLDFISPYLSKKLGKEVKYCPENTGEIAINFVNSLKPGDVAIMGNVRKHEGEEKNSDELASQFAKLGNFVAIGGFGKAHREEASNVGILKYLSGRLARSQVREMRLLVPWAGREENRHSVAVLGGIKKEKITIGLDGFAKTYGAIIPGGIVLNTILKVKGCNVGDSIIEDGGKTFEDVAKKVLDTTPRAEIFLPDRVIIANIGEHKDFRTININEGVPKGFMIVDFIIPEQAIASLNKAVKQRGRIIIAGTPGLYTEGFKSATDEILKRMRGFGVRGLVLGGDTVGEVHFRGTTSVGGGSALYFIANGTTPVLEALKRNKQEFPD